MIEIPFCGLYDASSSVDASFAHRVQNFILHDSNAFDRSNELGHVTGSAVVVCSSFEHMLMTHHAKLDRWLQLGGHCDGIKDPLFVAKKEAYEESGLRYIKTVDARILDIDIHPIPRRGDEREHLHYDIRYLFSASMDAPLTMSSESKRLEWVHMDALDRYTADLSILRIRDKVGVYRNARGSRGSGDIA